MRINGEEIFGPEATVIRAGSGGTAWAAHRPKCVSLEALLEHSMRRGYRRVALQRLLMLEARGLPISAEAQDFCHPLRMSLPRREYERMQAAAQAWARMVSGRGRGGFEG